MSLNEKMCYTMKRCVIQATIDGFVECVITFGHRVGTCCNIILGVVGSNLEMVKFEPTTPNMSQHGGQTQHVAYFCVEMLSSFGRDLCAKAPSKRSQQVNAIYRNIVGRNMLSAFGLHVATCCVMLRLVFLAYYSSEQFYSCWCWRVKS